MHQLIKEYTVKLEDSDSPFKGTIDIVYEIGITVKGYRLFRFRDGKQKVKEPVDCCDFLEIDKERLGEVLAVWQGHELYERYNK